MEKSFRSLTAPSGPSCLPCTLHPTSRRKAVRFCLWGGFSSPRIACEGDRPLTTSSHCRGGEETG